MITFIEFKRIFRIALIASLIISALIAVITILVGEFNMLAARVLSTLSMVVFHSLVSLAFLHDKDSRSASKPCRSSSVLCSSWW